MDSVVKVKNIFYLAPTFYKSRIHENKAQLTGESDKKLAATSQQIGALNLPCTVSNRQGKQK